MRLAACRLICKLNIRLLHRDHPWTFCDCGYANRHNSPFICSRCRTRDGDN